MPWRGSGWRRRPGGTTARVGAGSMGIPPTGTSLRGGVPRRTPHTRWPRGIPWSCTARCASAPSIVTFPGRRGTTMAVTFTDLEVVSVGLDLTRCRAQFQRAPIGPQIGSVGSPEPTHEDPAARSRGQWRGRSRGGELARSEVAGPWAARLAGLGEAGVARRPAVLPAVRPGVRPVVGGRCRRCVSGLRALAPVHTSAGSSGGRGLVPEIERAGAPMRGRYPWAHG